MVNPIKAAAVQNPRFALQLRFQLTGGPSRIPRKEEQQVLILGVSQGIVPQQVIDPLLIAFAQLDEIDFRKSVIMRFVT